MKLLIADDHTLFRDALVQYIERSNPEATVTLMQDLYGALDCLKKDDGYDLVILDLRMPGMDGLNGLKSVREAFPELRVALMSGVAEEEDVRAALSMGAVGYFPKTLSGRALLDAIHDVLQGEIFIPEGEDTEFLPSHYGDMDYDNVIEEGVDFIRRKQAQTLSEVNLTPRELEVLSYLVDGATNKEIANSLDLQLVTVKLHVRGICRKLDAANRTQAALKGKDLGVSSALRKNA